MLTVLEDRHPNISIEALFDDANIIGLAKRHEYLQKLDK
jgi:hypothetical protein